MKFSKLAGAILFAISLYILWQIRQVLLLAFTAVVFATVLNRLVRQLQQWHIKRPIAIFLSVGSVLGIFGGILAFIIPSLAKEWQQLVELVPQGLEQLRSWYQWLQNLIPGQLLTDIGSLENLFEELAESGQGRVDGFFTIFSNSLDFVLNVLLVIVVTIMLLANPPQYRRAFVLLFPAFYRRRIVTILDECEQKLVGWLVGMLFNMAIIGIFSSVGLWLLGIRLPFVNGIIATMLTWIPNIGPTISVIPPTALALLDAPWKALAVIGMYFGIQQLESNILTPLVMQKQVDLMPALTLLSQVTFAIFFGFLGLFLALPLVVVLQVWFRELLIKDVLDRWIKPEREEWGDDEGESYPRLRESSQEQS